MACDVSSNLIERNKEAFLKHHPGVWAALDRLGKTISSLVVEGGAVTNIDLGDIRLYPEAAAGWSENQLQEHLQNPDRVGFENPAHCNLSPVSRRLLQDINRYFETHPPEKIEDYPVADAGFGYIFGVGLGFHLPGLTAQSRCRYLVIIEPIPEFIIHSMAAIDWKGIFEDAAEAGMEIHFLLGKEPEATIIEIERLIITKGQTFLDGSYAYIHYYSWPIKETRKILNERLKTYYASRGYFEDEVLMMSNTYSNFRRWPSHIISRKGHLEQDMPLFIVGSGPSFDKDLPYIKKWRDRAIVFSCGTSLGILLKNGIRPDLHVENENTPQLVSNLRDFHDEYGFDGITLVASTTVNPDIGELFGKRWFYFRSHLSSSALLNGSVKVLVGAAPLVSNAAFAVVTTLGFKNVYLFGIDCGRKPEQGHHSRDAVYYQDDYDNYLEGESLELLETEFTRLVPGNFGGQVLTAWYLDMSRVSLSGLRRLSGIELINCSDGARIEGAKPKAAASIELAYPPGRQKTVLSRLEEQLKFFNPGEFLESTNLQFHADACDNFVEAFRELMDRALEEDRSFWELEQRLIEFRNENVFEMKGVLSIIGGTYTSMIRLGAFGGNRIPDDRTRVKFLRFFIAGYRDACLWMAGEIKTLLQEMAEKKPQLKKAGVIDAA